MFCLENDLLEMNLFFHQKWAISMKYFLDNL